MSPEGGGGSEAVWVALVTGPDRGKMMDLGRDVVGERLAACVNLIDGVRSVYRWDGRVQEDDEALAVIKTTRGRLDELEARVRELHPYDEPEFVALPVQEGSRPYLAWVADSVQPTTS